MVFVSCLIFVTTRLRSCEAASELLMSYRNGHEVEKKELNDLENGLRFQKIEDLGPSEAELELERLRVRIPSIYPIHIHIYVCCLLLSYYLFPSHGYIDIFQSLSPLQLKASVNIFYSLQLSQIGSLPLNAKFKKSIPRTVLSFQY